jgi:hypothetical protein
LLDIPLDHDTIEDGSCARTPKLTRSCRDALGAPSLPDRNPIENVCDILKHIKNRTRDPAKRPHNALELSAIARGGAD